MNIVAALLVIGLLIVLLPGAMEKFGSLVIALMQKYDKKMWEANDASKDRDRSSFERVARRTQYYIMFGVPLILLIAFLVLGTLARLFKAFLPVSSTLP